MQAAAIQRFGGPEEIKQRSVPVPDVGPDDVLIRIDTAGVGVWDPYVRDGRYFEDEGGGDPHFPYVLGVEGAGVVERVGGDVEGIREGDRVYTYTEDMRRGGLYAEYAVVKADLVAPAPESLDLEAAGAMPADAVTALCGLEALKLKPGEKLAIFGASGGIGHLAVQLAMRFDVKTIAIASGQAGVDLVLALGADAAVDGHGEEVAEAVEKFAPDGLDAALITASDKSLQAVLDAMGADARIAFPNGVEPEPTAPASVETHAYDGRSTPDRLRRLNRLIEDGPFTVHVSRRFPLDQASEAHRAVEQHHLGKIALRIDH
jgi:NADPH:quinone reductase-like Zn-dependent oxidoreductase